jgi:hypothetical protein
MDELLQLARSYHARLSDPAFEAQCKEFNEVLQSVEADFNLLHELQRVFIRGDRQTRKSASDEAQYFSLAMDYRFPLTGDFESYYGARLFLEAYSADHQGVGVSAGAGSLQLKSGSVPDRAAHDPALFDLGLFYRLYLTPPHVSLRPYATIQLNVGTMFWDYRDDPVSHGEEVKFDSVGWADACVGVGLVVNISKRCHIIGEVNYGGMSFFDTTYHDLKNELFDSCGYVTLKAGLGWTF